jgi:cytochrome c oxidase assembly protein subunit 15
VSSGLSERVDVAPERLTVHLGLALFLFVALVWTALDAWSGRKPADAGGSRWGPLTAGLLALVFVQCLLGGLVAGNDAGRVFNDWPLMGGELFPSGYGEAGGAWRTLAHDLAAVQLHHRIGGYLLFGAAWAFAALVWRRAAAGLKPAAGALAALVTGQMLLGIATLLAAVPLHLGVLHQAGAVLVLAAATALAWQARRLPRLGAEAAPGAAHGQGHARRIDVEEQHLAVG